MQFTDTQVLNWMASFMWPFIRVGAMFMTMPVVGTQTVPVRVRLILTLTVTLLISPNIQPTSQFEPLHFTTWLLILQQVLIGVSMGFVLQLVFGAIIMAGQIIALQMGLGFASMVDPNNGLQVPVISQLYLLISVLIFLALNGHLVMIEMVHKSFETLPVTKEWLNKDLFWLIISWGGQMFMYAVLISLPTMIAMLVVNISFGILTRSSPQLNIFAVGFPIMVTIGLAVVLVTLPQLDSQVQQLMDSGYSLIRKIIG